ncbi:MAG: ferrous iron transport protein B [Prosthecobacter sp.]|jgi:ferrous iron transport protein B|nr:ferrous iron transport protein B [Prosthecobacter sp.]
MSAPDSPLLAIVGNPNSGKTTLFNLLTGLRQKVANYPGVTVEKKIGECWSQHGKKLRLIDLPGAYSLNARSPDEAVLRDVLLGRRADTPRPDRVVLVLDAANLERNLYLASQILELGLPTVIALNMIDVAEARQWRIDVSALSTELGVPVIPMQATTGKGLLELKAAMSRADLPRPRWHSAPLPEDIRASVQATRARLLASGAIQEQASLLEPLYLLSDHDPLHAGIRDEQLAQIAQGRDALEKAHPGWEDQLVQDRYAAIEKLCARVLIRPECEPVTFSQKLDRWLLHPVLGGLFLLIFLVFLFYLIFKVAEGPMGWIEAAFASLGTWVTGLMPPGDLRDLLVDGAINGVSGVVVFLPQILILFFFIGLMEDTGYMARLAFIMDRLMSLVGLNGKAFLPFLSSYACAVPGVMAARTIDSPKDRLITILIAPLASCSARLPVYLLLLSALMPESVSLWVKAGIMVALYALGTFGAFVFAWILNKGIMRGASAPMILEMPAYRLPSLRSILLLVWQRARAFLVRAGTVIFGISILIWAASTYPKSDSPDASMRLEQSLAGRAGHLIEPIIAPLGFDWKIGIGLIGSFAAREVFVNTMAVVYAVEAGDEEDMTPLRDRLRQETRADGRPVYRPLVCISLLVFYVFAMQCVSTMAIVRRETGSSRWMWFQLACLSGTAYILSLLIYQTGSALGY